MSDLDRKLRLITSGIVIVSCVVSVILSWGRIDWRIDDLVDKFDSHCDAALIKYNKVEENEKSVLIIKNDVRYLKEEFQELKSDIKDQKDLLTKIYDKV